MSLNTSMISLGSCTMKLNAATEMMPLSWNHWSKIHPFVPKEQAGGYQQIIKELEDYLCKITAFDACSLQPNSGAQGEYAGLLTIKAFHESNNEAHQKCNAHSNFCAWYKSCIRSNGRNESGCCKSFGEWIY